MVRNVTVESIALQGLRHLRPTEGSCPIEVLCKVKNHHDAYYIHAPSIDELKFSNSTYNNKQAIIRKKERKKRGYKIGLMKFGKKKKTMKALHGLGF